MRHRAAGVCMNNTEQRDLLIVSRNFNPGHLAHLLATHRLICELGCAATLLVHPAFQSLLADSPVRSTTRLLNAEFRHRSRLLIVWFPSIRALLDIILSKILFRRCEIVYVFHEPFDSIQSYLAAGFGSIKTFKIVLVSIINYFIVLASSKIILPSSKAVDFFKKRYLHTNKPYARIPLIFDDEAGVIAPFEHRRFIAYIGTVAVDHAFEDFMAYALRAVASGSFKELSFLIATRSTLPSTLMARIAAVDTNGRIVIRQGKPMTAAEIGCCYRESVVVWNAYRRSMQSGVLPMAYMYGTPLLVAATNRSEFFVDGENGVEISSRYDFSQITAAIDLVVSDFNRLSIRCRADFLDIFYYKAQAVAFAEFIFGDAAL